MHYVILGAGPAGVTAAETLRELDATAKITLISGEAENPYSRMAIPYVLSGQIGENGTRLRQQPGHYENLAITIVHARAEKLDPASKSVTLSTGQSITFDKLLIATGARPLRPPVSGLDLPGVHTCWTLEDAGNIAARARKGADVVLMGAGFIGSIILEALVARGVNLTLVEIGDRMVPRMMDETAGNMLSRWCRARGVDVRTGTRIDAITAAGEQLNIRLDKGESRTADLVVVAAGVAPVTDFLDGSGISTASGILVDEHLRTSEADIFAVGDVAECRDFSTGKAAIMAIQPVAADHGRIAALNMAGRPTAYQGALAMNVLDTLGLISTSFGLWQGNGGDNASASDEDNYRYLHLEFDGDRLIGAQTVGLIQHTGILRGLIQSRISLGAWKEKLLAEPHRITEAYIACTQGDS